MKSETMKITRIIGSVYFALLGFLVLLYWNWPFGTGERFLMPFYGLMLTIAGFAVSFVRMRPGGWLIFLGVGIFYVAQCFNPREISLIGWLVSFIIFVLPPVIFGYLFVGHSVAYNGVESQIHNNQQDIV